MMKNNSHFIFFDYNNHTYYIDKRHQSPYDYEYDFWEKHNKTIISGRITDSKLVNKLTNYINRNKKIKKILGKTN